jgi:hypothetical protein
LHSNDRGADRSEFIVALLVAQQRAINTRTSKTIMFLRALRGFCDLTVLASGKYATLHIVVTNMTIVRQRFGKHILEVTQSTV